LRKSKLAISDAVLTTLYVFSFGFYLERLFSSQLSARVLPWTERASARAATAASSCNFRANPEVGTAKERAREEEIPAEIPVEDPVRWPLIAASSSRPSSDASSRCWRSCVTISDSLTLTRTHKP